MTTSAMTESLYAYFEGKYSDSVRARIFTFCDNLGDEERAKVLEYLIEHLKANFKVSVSELVEACKALGVGYKQARFVPSIEWDCEACGYRFRYSQAASDDDKIDFNTHDVCPHCGFEPGWTLYKRASEEKKTITPEYKLWHARQIDTCKEKFDNSGFGKCIGGNWTKGGGKVFWDRSAAEEERRERKSIPIAAVVSNLATAKGQLF